MLKLMMDPDAPMAARVIYGIGSVVILVGVILAIVGGAWPAVMLAGLLLFGLALLIDRTGR